MAQAHWSLLTHCILLPSKAIQEISVQEPEFNQRTNLLNDETEYRTLFFFPFFSVFKEEA